MNFQDLHELLRLELLRRIHSGDLTGTALARQAGFQQGHISNYLNRRRSLSLEGLDRVLAAQGLSVDALMPAAAPLPGQLLELSASAVLLPPVARPAAAAEFASIPVVSPSAAMDEAVVRAGSVLESLAVSAARLAAVRAEPLPGRAGWQRFVALRADGAQAAAMDPMLPAGATVVLDRHCQSLALYGAPQRPIYAVRTGTGAGAGLALRYVEFDAGTLILRPHAAGFPVQLVPVRPRRTPADYLAGRVCLLLAEL